jgi:hypothetical protein
MSKNVRRSNNKIVANIALTNLLLGFIPLFSLQVILETIDVKVCWNIVHA